MDEPKYQPHIEQVQGMAIGDHNVINNYFGGVQSLPSVSSVWNIPFARNTFFIGRDDLLVQLHQRLTLGKRTLALYGLDGVGKTQVALEYAYRYREVYPFVLWVRAENREMLITEFVTLAMVLQLPEQDNQDHMKVAGAVKRWLEAHEGWLLICDNAENLSLLSDLLPTSGRGHMLLTTRAPNTRPLAEPLEVEMLDEETGTLFLLRRANLLAPTEPFESASPDNQRAARQLCQLLGALPLALDQAGSYIDEVQCEIWDYLAFYQQDLQTRQALLQHADGLTTNQSVVTTWSLAFSRVEQTGQAAVDLLRACAFLSPDLIPEDLLQKGAQQWGKALAEAAENRFFWNEIVKEPLKYSLLRRSREQRALVIHRLVQTVLRDTMDVSMQQQWAKQTMQAVNQVFPAEIQPATWSTCQHLLAHVQSCAELMKRYEPDFPEAADLLSRAARYLRAHARYDEAASLYQQALAIRERVLGPDHPHTAASLNNLALLYYDQGKYEQAEPLFQRALAIYRQGDWTTQLALASSLNNLATLYAAQGRYEEAEPLQQQALEVIEQWFGPEHPDTALHLNNLATLYEKEGKYEQAEPLHVRALAIREKVLGTEHPHTASSLNNLANLYRSQGKYEQAEPLALRTLAIYEQVMGPEHPDTAMSLNNLANLYRDQSKYEQAEPLYQRTLAIAERVLGAEHPHTATSLNNLALLYEKQGKYKQAEPLYQRAVTIRKSRLGSAHPDTVKSLKQYTALLEKMKHEKERSEEIT